jgi:hypothetical protein
MTIITPAFDYADPDDIDPRRDARGLPRELVEMEHILL